MSYPIGATEGMLTEKHKRRMGAAVWYFLLFVNWQTDSDGNVLGGKPITCHKCGQQFGDSERTARRMFVQLKDQGYIRLKRHPSGYIVQIANPKKVFKRGIRPDRSDQSRPDNFVRSDRTEVASLEDPDRTTLSARPDTSVRQTGHICPVPQHITSQGLAKDEPEEGLPDDAFEQIERTYPKNTKRAQALAEFRNQVGERPTSASCQAWFRGVLSAATTCSKFPLTEQRYLPSLADFIRDRWEDDWERELARCGAATEDSDARRTVFGG